MGGGGKSRVCRCGNQVNGHSMLCPYVLDTEGARSSLALPSRSPGANVEARGTIHIAGHSMAEVGKMGIAWIAVPVKASPKRGESTLTLISV